MQIRVLSCAYDWIEILQRIEAGENARTEFKRSIDNKSAIGKTLCSFANGNGGVLLLGIDDAGQILGVKGDPTKIHEKLTNILNNSCNHPISAQCGYHRTKDIWVHWIQVERHNRGYLPFSFDGRFWIRRSRSTVAPSDSELQELFNVFGSVYTELRVIAAATQHDINMDVFFSFMRSQGLRMLEKPQLDIESDLSNSSVCGLHNEVLRPTLYGLMIFGRNPQGHQFTTSMFIQCVAYAGVDRASNVLSSGEAKGRLDEQVHRAIGWFQSLGRKEVFQGLHRIDIPLIPEAVLREALVNAVIHRDYSVLESRVLLEVFDNRIDVTSPGTLPNHMTVEQVRLGGSPRSRNEMMANAMVVFGLMERRGRGWLSMRHEMYKFNNTEPKLVNQQGDRFVRVTFHFEADNETVKL